VAFAPLDRNRFPFFCSTDLVYQGLMPRHDGDTTAFDLAYGKFSRDLRGQGFEMILELTDALALPR
jgi:hypothetical protein